MASYFRSHTALMVPAVGSTMETIPALIVSVLCMAHTKSQKFSFPFFGGGYKIGIFMLIVSLVILQSRNICFFSVNLFLVPRRLMLSYSKYLVPLLQIYSYDSFSMGTVCTVSNLATQSATAASESKEFREMEGRNGTKALCFRTNGYAVKSACTPSHAARRMKQYIYGEAIQKLLEGLVLDENASDLTYHPSISVKTESCVNVRKRVRN